MATLIGTTVPGLETAAAALVGRQHGLTAEPRDDGAVHVSVPGAPDGPAASRAAVRLNRRCRCLHRVGILLGAGRIEGAADCYRLTRSVELAPLLESDRTFAVRPFRRGDHRFGSPEIGRQVGQAVIDGYRQATGQRLPVDLDDPDVILRAEVHDDRFRLWLDTTGDQTLSQRAYRQRHHPAGLDPCLAHLMLEVGGWRGEPVLDPMCGNGTIPVEAALARLDVPAWRLRSVAWAWERLGWSPALADVDRAPPESPGTIPMLGVEISPKHVQAAWKVVAAAGMTDHVRIVQGDATRLEQVVEPPGIYRLAVLNPPFGRRMGSRRKIKRLYPAFCAAARRARVARLVILVELLEPMEEALEEAGYRLERRLSVRQGDLDVHVVHASSG